MPRMKLDSEFHLKIPTVRMLIHIDEIILCQGSPKFIFSTYSEATNTAKEIWDNVKMLYQVGENDMKITPNQKLKFPLISRTPSLSTTFPLLLGSIKQFPPTNNQLRSSSNSRTHATVHDGQIVTETVQRRALGNVGNTGSRGNQSYGNVTTATGKKVICYNCRGEGHVARQCKEPKRAKDSQYFKDKMLLMEAKEKGVTLDAEVEAFLANMECTAPYDQPLAMATTNIFEVNHEDAYDSDVDEGPNAAAAFMANLSSTSGNNHHVNETISTPYHQLELERRAKVVPTEVSTRSSANISMVTILDEMRDTLDEKTQENLDLSLENQNLTAELAKISNCLCEDLRSACDREHTKVLELEAEISKQKQLITESEKRFAFLEQNYVNLQLKFQNYKQCIDTSSASNAIFEINKLRQQLQGKDDTIRNLDAQINIMKVLNVGTTEGSCDQQALETDRIQLKDTITSLRIQLDGLKVENVSLKRRYDELSQANTHSRTAYTEKLSALTAENTKLKAQVTGTTSSGPSTSETPKVLAPGMYNLGSKYIPPPKRANWVKPTPLPKKKQVTFSEPPRPSLKPTQKPVVHPKKQTNVCVPMSTGVKPTSGASKTVPKRAPRNHSSLPVKSANARRVEAHHRTLNKKNRVDSNLLVKHSVSVSKLNNVCAACNKSLVIANHTDCLVMCDGSVNVKPHQTKRFKRQPKKEWKPIKRVWKPISKPVANSKPQWKPTGRHFSLFEKYPLTRIMEPTDMPIELPPSASSSPQITMVSRFTDHKLSDRKAGSTDCSMVSGFWMLKTYDR
ncbi:retrovirus-related pol polyprotein from transposon TNT 1-94 [Tanacetum coccineum]